MCGLRIPCYPLNQFIELDANGDANLQLCYPVLNHNHWIFACVQAFHEAHYTDVDGLDYLNQYDNFNTALRNQTK